MGDDILDQRIWLAATGQIWSDKNGAACCEFVADESDQDKAVGV